MNKSTALPKNLESQEYERMTADDVLTRLATDLSAGLKKTEVEHRRQRFGANEVPEKKAHPLRSFLKKFWGLTAWMLELIIVLSWILHKNADAYIVGGLLIMNSIINFLEEQKASGAVEELKSKLQIQARTLRDGVWALVPARELVPGDILRVRPGDFIPADMKILNGALAVDESALTGESLPLEKKTGDLLYAGSVYMRDLCLNEER